MSKSWKKQIGIRLRMKRKSMGMTQRDVMRALGHTSTTQISLWESGERLPDSVNMMFLSALYKTMEAELFYELRQQALEKIEVYYRQRSVDSNNDPPDI